MLPTHKSSHTQDLVIANEFSNIIGNVTAEPVKTIIDNKIVSFKVKLCRNLKMTKKIALRKLDDLN